MSEQVVWVLINGLYARVGLGFATRLGLTIVESRNTVTPSDYDWWDPDLAAALDAAQTAAAEAQAARDEAVLISGIDTTDEAMAAVDINAASDFRVQQDARHDARYIPRSIPDTAQIISTFLGNGQVFWEDHDNIPIFSIPAAGGPRVFGDFLGAWCGVFDKAIELTPWGSLRFGYNQTKQLFLCTAGPLDAETIDQMERMGDGGHTDAIAEVGDIAISSNDERLLWRCITSGTPGSAGNPLGSWVPATVGSSIKSITNHNATGTVADYEELLYCWNTITLTLPDPATLIHGREFTVKNAGSGTVTVAAHSGNIIDGAASKALTAGQFSRFVAITSGWTVV